MSARRRVSAGSIPPATAEEILAAALAEYQSGHTVTSRGIQSYIWLEKTGKRVRDMKYTEKCIPTQRIYMQLVSHGWNCVPILGSMRKCYVPPMEETE